MRVVIISPHPGFGGASTANINIAKSITMAGHEVIYMDEYFSENINESIHFKIDRYPIHKNGFLKQYRTFKHLSAIKPDYIIFGMPIVALYIWVAILCLRYKGVHVGCLFHSLSLSVNFKGLIIDFLISCFTFICKHLFFVSNYTLRSWNKYALIRKKINASYIMFNPVEKPIDNTFEHINTKINVGFVGRFSIEKQPKIFCETARFFNKSKDIDFVAFGDGPLFKDCINEYSDTVNFMGYCNDRGKIYSHISILLMTSMFENCPMAILESLVRGIPVIAPKVGGIPELISSGKNGELYEEFSVKTIKICLEQIIRHYNDYSQNALESAKPYTLQSMAKKWDVVFSENQNLFL